MRTRRFTTFALIGAFVLVGSTRGNSQPATTPNTLPVSTPCCFISKINLRSGSATANSSSTSGTIQFKAGRYLHDINPLTDPYGPLDFGKLSLATDFEPTNVLRLFGTLKIGQKVWVSPGGKVSLTGRDPCCGVVAEYPPTGSSPGKGSGGLTKEPKRQAYSIDSAARVSECNRTARTSFPNGGHVCFPKATLISSGTQPDGVDATYNWRCACS
ncbi:MAG: hypothetical protein ACR2NS_06455 [Gemmatimonadaceae bacterium]